MLILASFVIVLLILWNTYSFFQIFKNEERVKMELWASAQKSLMTADVDTELDLPLEIITNNTSIPNILVAEKDSIIAMNNLEKVIVENSPESKKILNQLKKQNDPIIIEYIPGKFRYLYYGCLLYTSRCV